MKNRISPTQIIYLVLTLCLLGLYSFGGARGYRLLGVFTSPIITHTGPNGIHHK